MTVPVIKNVLEQNPALKITFVSNAFFAPMFEGLEHLEFFGVNLKTEYTGATGMYRLYKALKSTHNFTAVVDLHYVLRSILLTAFFKISGYKTAVIDKGRKEKKALTQKENKSLHQLTPMHNRYAEVFNKAGFPVILKNDSPVYPKQKLPIAVEQFFLSGKRVIGLAPFAQHAEKMYPIDKMKTVAQELATNHIVLLFGGGKEESAVLQTWENEITGLKNVSGKFSFQDELAIISNLDTMISMDSANMHLASLFGVKVVSIWGATHPFAGFYGWGQLSQDIVQIDLPCRPCSVFGNKPCYRGDNACMNNISAQQIINKLQ